MTITGYIQNYDGQALTIVAPFTVDYLLERQAYPIFKAIAEIENEQAKLLCNINR